MHCASARITGALYRDLGEAGLSDRFSHLVSSPRASLAVTVVAVVALRSRERSVCLYPLTEKTAYIRARQPIQTL